MDTTNFIAFIAAAVSAIAALASWFALVITVNSNRVTLLRQAEADWDNVRKNYREQFWTSIEKAYSRFLQSRRNVPVDITNFIYSAYMPPSVPIKKSEHLRDWYVNHGRKMNSDQREMWSFVTSIYPPKSPGTKKVTDGSVVVEKERDSFHDSR